MSRELYEAFKRIDINKLDDADIRELLKIFMNTGDLLVRNHVSFIFSDLDYNEAIPYILKKINQKDLYNYNGSLVWSLWQLDTRKYFIPIIKIICEQDYESRVTAYSIIERDLPTISDKTRIAALKLLKKYKLIEEKTATDKGKNSRLHFIKSVENLLGQSKGLSKILSPGNAPN